MLSLLVSLLVRACRVPRNQAETVIKGLLEREQFTTAAVGNGLALPHLRTPAVRQPVGAVAIVPHGVNFSVPYGMPIRLVLLVLFPEDGRREQIEFIERLVSLAKDETLSDLVTPELTPAKVYDFLCTWDSRWQASN